MDNEKKPKIDPLLPPTISPPPTPEKRTEIRLPDPSTPIKDDQSDLDLGD